MEPIVRFPSVLHFDKPFFYIITGLRGQRRGAGLGENQLFLDARNLGLWCDKTF